MKKIHLFLLLTVMLISLCSCATKESVNAATGKSCVKCGDAATHFAGTGWVESQNRNAALYLCDDCYESTMDWYEDNNRVVNDRWWEK